MAEAVPFGRYQVDRRLGVGPTVELLLGQVVGGDVLHKPVLIKRMLVDCRDDQESVSKLIDEAKLGARLVHPSLIELYELGEANGVGFIAFEYLEGVDLERIISQSATRERAIPLEVVLHVIADAALGLAFAHAVQDEAGRPLNVLHGNLTPASIVVTARGSTKVADFVLALPGSGVVAMPSLKGKACYLSPEQLRGEAASARSDVFSLGAVFYELLTLRPCFKGATPEETLAAARAGGVGDVAALRPDLPAKIEGLLKSMLDPDPKLRCPGAASVAEFLKRALAEHSRPSADGVAAHVWSLMESTVRTAGQIHMPLAGIAVPVNEDLSDPALEVTSEVYRRLCSSPAAGGTAIDIVLAPLDRTDPALAPIAPVERTLVIPPPADPEAAPPADPEAAPPADPEAAPPANPEAAPPANPEAAPPANPEAAPPANPEAAPPANPEAAPPANPEAAPPANPEAAPPAHVVAPAAAQRRVQPRPPAKRTSGLLLGAVIVLGLIVVGLAIAVAVHRWAPPARSTVEALPPGSVPPPR